MKGNHRKWKEMEGNARKWKDMAGNEWKRKEIIGNTISFNHRSLPIGYIISVGNQTCVTIEDVIEYVLNDKRVTAIGIYAESFTNVELLIEVLEKAKQNKVPVAIVKVGRSIISAKTIKSHTGSLSGKEDFYDALFNQLTTNKILDKQLFTLKNLENKISISEKRDLHINANSFNNIDWKKTLLYRAIHSTSGVNERKLILLEELGTKNY